MECENPLQDLNIETFHYAQYFGQANLERSVKLAHVSYADRILVVTPNQFWWLTVIS